MPIFKSFVFKSFDETNANGILDVLNIFKIFRKYFDGFDPALR